MDHVIVDALINVRPLKFSKWKMFYKRLFDIVVSLSVLVLLSPVFLIIAWRVKRSSPGPVIYSQPRIGLNGKPFTIYKFRSMVQGAEKNGPQLSSHTDERCTPFGATMRKWRIDELPQFWNVLKNDMSIVGPRPERAFYAEQIINRAPAFKALQTVRPGITSLGMVKFGYASTIDQMVQRMKFDIFYLENRSLYFDFLILFQTIKIIMQGKGK